MHPGTELLAAWVAAFALAAVRGALALADGARGSPWLAFGVALWIGLPVAIIALGLVAGSPRRKTGTPAERAESGPIAFGLGIGLYTVPYVLGLAAPWLGVPAALRIALAVFAVLTLLCWGLAFASSHPSGRLRPR